MAQPHWCVLCGCGHQLPRNKWRDVHAYAVGAAEYKNSVTGLFYKVGQFDVLPGARVQLHASHPGVAPTPDGGPIFCGKTCTKMFQARVPGAYGGCTPHPRGALVVRFRLGAAAEALPRLELAPGRLIKYNVGSILAPRYFRAVVEGFDEATQQHTLRFFQGDRRVTEQLTPRFVAQVCEGCSKCRWQGCTACELAAETPAAAPAAAAAAAAAKKQRRTP